MSVSFVAFAGDDFGDTPSVIGTGTGNATITCTVTDEKGIETQETCEVNVKFTFLQWIIRILLLGFLWY